MRWNWRTISSARGRAGTRMRARAFPFFGTARDGSDMFTRVLCGLTIIEAMGLPVARADTVGNVDVDWLGNDIIIEAFEDPKVAGVTCHVAYFERGLIDRLQKGNWFEDPSNSSIDCRQTGEIEIGDIARGDEGESVFSERLSIIWKSLKVKRIFDERNQTLIYISHARDVQDGSAKMSMSTVPLYSGS